MLLFLNFIRYGSEAALLTVHWEDHKLDETPELLFTMVQDLVFIALLFLYVYVCLAFTPIKPTPLELVEGGNTALASAAQGTNITTAVNHPSTSQQNSTDPDSQGFNYALRRNVGQLPKDTNDKVMLEEIERQKQRNSLLLREGGGVIETDLDAVPAKVSEVNEKAEEPSATLQLPKFRKSAATKRPPIVATPPEPKEPEKTEEPGEDFWASMNGDAAPEMSSSYKTTSV